MRRVEQIMGMPISIEISDCQDEAVFQAAFERLRQIDERFSTYKDRSEVSRYARGELKRPRKELAAVITACQEAAEQTNGYFDAWASGSFDPSGYVKGWAIAQTGKLIEKQGYKTYCIGAGGDILASSASQKVWNIGIQDPFDRSKILNKLSISNGAVCTSGNYIRGAHIINPKTAQPASYWASVTVAGPDVIKADVLATACFAMGEAATEFMRSQDSYQMIAVPA